MLRKAWDNLGRTACEYVHMERIWDFDEARPNTGRIQIAPEVIERFDRLRDDGKPALIFAAHLANWELPAIAAARHGLQAAALYRRPNNPIVARDILALRAGSMGELIPAGIAAPIRMLEALDRGLHVGMLVDQRFGRGPRVAFLGRPAASNPLLARLARRFDCPVHGARAIRLPGGRFRLEITEEIELPRDARGRVDIEAATALVNGIVAGWVREHPGPVAVDAPALAVRGSGGARSALPQHFDDAGEVLVAAARFQEAGGRGPAPGRRGACSRRRPAPPPAPGRDPSP